jgi:acyl-CoA dehydrogenase
MISDPTAGSDVQQIRATAERVGDFYKVNGLEKWITGANMADFFMTVMKTGEKNISRLAIPRDLPGISIRKMENTLILDMVRIL